MKQNYIVILMAFLLVLIGCKNEEMVRLEYPFESEDVLEAEPVLDAATSPVIEDDFKDIETDIVGCSGQNASSVTSYAVSVPENVSIEIEIVEPESSIDNPPSEEIVKVESDLEALLIEELSSYDGSWSVYFKRLDNGSIVSISNEPKVAASLIKLFVAGAYFDAVCKGTLEDTYQSDLSVMITESSNDACNRIIDVLGNGDASLGMSVVTDFATSIGCSASQLNRKMLQVSELENYTSAIDCGMVLDKIFNGTYVNEATSEELLELLKKQNRTWKIPSGVPAGTETANKTGELSDVENDVAIIWSPACTYILCIMVEEVQSPGITQGNIASISKLVYEYLNP